MDHLWPVTLAETPDFLQRICAKLSAAIRATAVAGALRAGMID